MSAASASVPKLNAAAAKSSAAAAPPLSKRSVDEHHPAHRSRVARHAHARINLQAVADQFGRTPGQIRRWFKDGVGGLPYETVLRIEELSDVDMRLLVERGKHTPPTATSA